MKYIGEDFSSTFQKKYKNCLFRYRAFTENNLNALEHNQLYFSIPKYFNDPFDNLIFVNGYEIISEILGNISIGMDSYLEKTKNIHPAENFLTSEIWKKKSSRDNFMKNYGDYIWSIIDGVKIIIRDNVKVICFSEIYDSMLMWSHYADNHKGFCLIYDKEELKKAKRFSLNNEEINQHTRLDKVQYVETQVDMTEDVTEYIRYNILPNLGDVEQKDKTIPNYKYIQAIIQKSKEWEYEKEWRLIPRIINISEPSELHYIVCKPKGIILGAHANNENREKILKIAKKEGIPVYHIYLDEADPAFHFKINTDKNVKTV